MKLMVILSILFLATANARSVETVTATVEDDDTATINDAGSVEDESDDGAPVDASSAPEVAAPEGNDSDAYIEDEDGDNDAADEYDDTSEDVDAAVVETNSP